MISYFLFLLMSIIKKWDNIVTSFLKHLWLELKGHFYEFNATNWLMVLYISINKVDYC